MSMKRLLAAVAVSVLLVAGCGAESSSPEDAPFDQADADKWFAETQEFSDCLFPDLPDTRCEATAQVRSKEVTLQPGMVLEQYEPMIPTDDSPPPVRSVEITVPQSIWCFVVRHYSRWPGDEWTDAGDGVSYSYPCWALGPNSNEGLDFLVGYLEPDGGLSQSRMDTCRYRFPGEANRDGYRECWDAATTADILTEEPTW